MSDFVDIANEKQQWLVDTQVAKCIQHVKLSPTDDTKCIDCGADIGEKRKLAVPSAVRCIDCQNEYELMQVM